ncbi:MAG: prepilin peptidase [Deltaproteobacteria bacterium]|nr:prepilin peptidase [Deltaproteobacteria bacterium]
MMTTAVWACLAVVAISVVSDIATRRIPNLVTLGGIALGVVIHGAGGFVDGGIGGLFRGVGLSLLGALLCGFIPFFAWKKGELGGGDVKLFAAIGALMGLSMGFDVEARAFAFSFLILFPYRLVRHRAVGVALANVRIGIANLFRSKDARVPYATGPKLPPVILGPAIGFAFALTLVQHGVLR